MDKGNLTARSNNKIASFRYSGGFGQPDGFASVLTVSVNKEGNLTLSLTYKRSDLSSEEHFWAVTLTDSQRQHLASWIGEHKPQLWEEISQ